ncbi:uncharacterized protein BYT42DRAFT_610433 [Radiomyces spectabilis]|uniref:uncharacterized protein n=1 Tax=Radiomyces spectabilis TaxID=64574 RepID=UPI0022200539|nr:uncharacterized protein BYT42DRAFT_610433 [Radiomyces spectabilis]KAI8391184.1 hypothetical protein BYT42DRAFT_610433 [Radiomyces spectabilis]
MAAFIIYKFLCKADELFNNPQEFTDLLTLLRSPVTATDNSRSLLELTAPHFQNNPPRQQLGAQAIPILTAADYDPAYAALLTRVVDSFGTLKQVTALLRDEVESSAFVHSLLLEEPNATHHQVMSSLNGFLQTLSMPIREAVTDVLNSQRHSSDAFDETHSDNSKSMLVQCERIIDDENLYNAFTAILDQHYVNRIPWSDMMLQVYELIKLHKPEIWERLMPVLEYMRSEQDEEQYDSYEEYVRKNFLEDGGQQFLESEADRAEVEHMLGGLTVTK